ncbi:MAG TPA: 2-dehydropantoate 2-reductase N-terminal domain-containing protein, partial [Geminicoccaceae bacterium]|nr:2-dehydropantoate 2-reductase N-terminal domain-containing protein [Geminicoccaceae bacterium]
RLATSGQDVTFIARGAHLDAIRQRGLRLESALGDITVQPAQASDDPASIGPVDLVIFAVKLYDTEAAAEGCRPLVGDASGVVTFQNGVDSPEVLSRVLGREHVIGGVAQIASVVAAPGLIKHTGTMARFAFGELEGRGSARVEALAAAMRPRASSTWSARRSDATSGPRWCSSRPSPA